MNKEFIGKKKFYLDDNPNEWIVARVYVVETRNSEYLTAVLENGEAFRIELIDGPSEELTNIESFRDLDNRLFVEYASYSIKDVPFYDRKNNLIGYGEVGLFKAARIVWGYNILPTRSFKYKKNGWDFTWEAGNRIVAELDRVSVSELEDKYFQITCNIPSSLKHIVSI